MARKKKILQFTPNSSYIYKQSKSLEKSMININAWIMPQKRKKEHKAGLPEIQENFLLYPIIISDWTKLDQKDYLMKEMYIW